MSEVPSSLGSLTTILNTVSAAAKCFSAAEQVFAFVTGSNGNQAVINAIQELEQAITSEMKALIAAVTDQTWQQQWQPFAQNISGIQTTTANIAQQFGTLQRTGNGYTIDCGNVIPLDVWAAGGQYEQITYESALRTLYGATVSLWDQFQVGGDLNQSILHTWGSLFQLGPSDVVQNFSGQSSLTAYHLMMHQVYGMLSTIFYLHESILALYCTTYGNRGSFSSLGPYVGKNFGNVGDPSTVWGQFSSVMNDWPPILADYRVVATSGDSWTGADGYHVISRGGGAPGGAQFWNQWTRASFYSQYQNAFFTNVQIQIDASESDDFPNYYLLGTLSTIGPGAEITAQQQVTSYDPSQVGGDSGSIIFFNRESYGYVNVAYSTPPEPLPPGDWYNVVTGFCFCIVYGNRLALQLEYGQLNLTDPSNPTVKVVGEAQPSVGTYFGVQGNAYFNDPEIDYIDLRPSGTSTGFPIDNISLIQTMGTGTGNRVGLLVRSGWNVFDAAFMQPTNTLVPNQYTPPGG